MNIKYIFLIFFILHQYVSAQSTFEIKGRIIDDASQKPISYATIYVDKTTKGTTSNRDGRFVLSNISGSAVIVISHVSYYPKTIELNNQNLSEITISLQERSMEISPVMVEDKNLRNRNLELFKSMFIGRDYWGRNVKLLNDSVLSFVSHYNYPKKMLDKEVKKDIQTGAINNIVEWADDSTFIIVEELSKLEVNAKAPLEIDMPLLGYKLWVDLIDFSMIIDEQNVQVDFLGHYNFNPYELNKKSEISRIERNRRMAYFNSGKHLFRSLYENKLDENGYIIEESATENASKSIKNENADLKQHANYIDSDKLHFIGLKGKSYSISYYQNYKNEPFDVRKLHRPALEDPYRIEKSELYFLKDTCIINRKGTISNYDILFGGAISQKRVGSYLPENYELKE